jgi:hypothetical protein
VYDAADIVEKRKARKHLVSKSSSRQKGQSTVVVPPYQRKQVVPKRFRYDANMCAIGARMLKAGNQLHNEFFPGALALGNTTEQRNLITSSIRVLRCGFLHFQRNHVAVLVRPVVLGGVSPKRCAGGVHCAPDG